MLGSADPHIVDRLQVPILYDATQWLDDPTYSHFIKNALTALELKDTYQHQSTAAHSTLIFDESQNNGRGKYIFSLIKDMDHVYPNGNNNAYHFVAAERYWTFFKNNPKL